MSEENKDIPVSKTTEINIPGDGHTFIGNTNAVNITGPANVILAGEQIPKIEVVPFGDLQITLEDSKLLDEFKTEYDEVILECVKTDFTAPWVDIDLYDKIDLPYHEKWDVKSLKFKKNELRKLVTDMLSSLLELSGYLTEQYMRVVDTPRGPVLIAKNQSIEEGDQLRDVLRPETNKLRYKLRDLYRELHPEEYEGVPPFEDHYGEE